MSEVDTQEYLRIAESAQIFEPQDLEVLREVLEEFKRKPDTDYFVFEEKKEDAVVGFVIFGRAPLTKSSWEIYWLIVDKNFQGKGIGKRLIQRVENFILQKEKRPILKVETSSKREYSHARNLYSKQGFKELGRISDFYTKGDDLIILYKEFNSEIPS